VQQGVAPQFGNELKCSWLYAGNPEHPAVLVLIGVTPTWYDNEMSSENPSGAGNQQERPGSEEWIVGFTEGRDPVGGDGSLGIASSGLGTWNPQRPYASHLSATER
jgi:hypothetical protein